MSIPGAVDHSKDPFPPEIDPTVPKPRPFNPETDLDPVSLAAWRINPDKYNPYVLGNLERYAKWYGNNVAVFDSAPSWEDFENYASQALSKPGGLERAAEVLINWAAEKPEVRGALDVFLYEALAAHLGICQGCSKPIVSRPAANVRMYHDDACRKRAARSK